MKTDKFEFEIYFLPIGEKCGNEICMRSEDLTNLIEYKRKG